MLWAGSMYPAGVHVRQKAFTVQIGSDYRNRHCSPAGESQLFFLAIGRRLRYLLDKQIARLEKDFLEKSGLKELMYKARVDYRRRQ